MLCPSGQSCQGRCGEQFRRGQLCECDPQCARHNTCCPDYQLYCGEASLSLSNLRREQETFRKQLTHVSLDPPTVSLSTDAGVSSSHPANFQPLRAAAAAAAPAAGSIQPSTTKQQHSFHHLDLRCVDFCIHTFLLCFVTLSSSSSSSSGTKKSKKGRKKSNSESEEQLPLSGRNCVASKISQTFALHQALHYPMSFIKSNQPSVKSSLNNLKGYTDILGITFVCFSVLN